MKSIQFLMALFLLSASAVSTATPIAKQPAPLTIIVPSITEGVFGAFHVHRQQAGVALAWNVTTDDVVDFIVERSYDGSSFQPIDHVIPDNSAWNRYKDNAALPGYIYYRVKAILSDGTFEYSPTEVVRIVRRG